MPAHKRLDGAQAHSEGLRRGDGFQRSGRRLRRRYPAVPRNLQGRPGSTTFIPISTTIRPTGRRTTRTPALEIIAQTDGRITHFVALHGNQRNFHGQLAPPAQARLPGVQCISAQPSAGFHGLEGLKHMPTAIVPGIYDPKLADGNVWIETEDAYRMVPAAGSRRRRCWWAFLRAPTWWLPARWRRKLAGAGERGVIVTMLCDGAEKYLSEQFWHDTEFEKAGPGIPWCRMPEKTYPNECCGVMLGSIDGDRNVREAVPLPKMLTRDRRRTRYEHATRRICSAPTRRLATENWRCWASTIRIPIATPISPSAIWRTPAPGISYRRAIHKERAIRSRQ